LDENVRPEVLFVRTSSGHPPASAFTADAVKNASARTRTCVREDALASGQTCCVRADTLPPIPSPTHPPPLPSSLPSAIPASVGRGKKFKFFIKKLVIFFGSCCRPGKRKKIYNLQFTIFGFRFSVFNPQNPRTPRTPQTPRAPRPKPREEEGFFGLVPLVTHPSSIALLGGLTPKFLSLSLHSL
jgi:hypothetical protein